MDKMKMEELLSDVIGGLTKIINESEDLLDTSLEGHEEVQEDIMEEKDVNMESLVAVAATIGMKGRFNDLGITVKPMDKEELVEENVYYFVKGTIGDRPEHSDTFLQEVPYKFICEDILVAAGVKTTLDGLGFNVIMMPIMKDDVEANMGVKELHLVTMD